MKTIQLMNIQRQHEENQAEYENAVIKVLRSGQYIGGEIVEAFEDEFRSYINIKHAVSVGNGTDALIIALKALNIGPGDEVITPSFTYFATGEAIAQVGARPVFVDVLPDTFCMNPSLIETVISPMTKAILPVHLYGHSADMDRINLIAQKHSLYVIEDCAQSIGAKYKGKNTGTLSTVACFSFFPTKNLGCAGDGGMIVTNNDDIATACRALKAHGSGENGLATFKKRSDFERISEKIELGTTKYHHYLIGYNSRLDTIQASLLRTKLLKLDSFIQRRRAIAEMYNNALKNLGYGIPHEASYSFHSYYIYALRHPKSKDVIDSLNKYGIQSGVYYPIPLHLQGAFSYLGYKNGDLPITEELSKTTFALPVYPELTSEEIQEIISVLISINKIERK